VVGCLVKCVVKVYGTRLPPPLPSPGVIPLVITGGEGIMTEGPEVFGVGEEGVTTRMTKTNVSFHTHMIIA
jgi:hypothetical protein